MNAKQEAFIEPLFNDQIVQSFFNPVRQLSNDRCLSF